MAYVHAYGLRDFDSNMDSFNIGNITWSEY